MNTVMHNIKMSLLINNIAINPIIKSELTEYLQDALQFVEDSGEDQHITYSIPGYTPHEIASTYIFCGGHTCVHMNDKMYDVMMKLYAKYPGEVQHELDTKSAYYIVKNCIDICADDSIHVARIFKFIKYLVSFDANNIVSFEYDGVERFMKYMTHIYDSILCYVEKIDHAKFYHKQHNLCYKPYEIIDGKYEVTSNEMLKIIISFGRTTNLCLNFNVTKPLCERIHSSNFETWKLGPKCHELSRLFKGYSGQPKIEGWNFDSVTHIYELFENSAIRDLSMIHFRNVTHAPDAFRNCVDLERSPHFYKVKNATGMFYGCKKLTEQNVANGSLIGMDYMFVACELLTEIYTAGETFINAQLQATFMKCYGLNYAFKDCKFYGTTIIGTTFYKCNWLKGGFVNCYFEHVIFEGDINLDNCKTLFDNCVFDKINVRDKEHRIFGPKIRILGTSVFCNCTFKIDNKIITTDNRGIYVPYNHTEYVKKIQDENHISHDLMVINNVHVCTYD